jgi:uncharacterized membrane protein
MEFLKSTRFWVMIIGAASAVLIDPSFATAQWYESLGKFLSIVAAGFITVRTVDRASEKLGASAVSETTVEGD